MIDPDWPALLIPPAGFAVSSVGALGIATSILGRRATNPWLLRMLGSTKVDGRTTLTLYGLAWDVLFVIVGQAPIVVLLADGLNRGLPLRVAAAICEFLAATVFCVVLVRGTTRDGGEDDPRAEEHLRTR